MLSSESKEKKRKSMTKNLGPYCRLSSMAKKCKWCKRPHRSADRKYCSDQCLLKAQSKFATDINLGGNRNRYAKGWYDSPIAGKVYLESSWELELAKILDELVIQWIRPDSMNWIDDNGVTHKYFADFYLMESNLYLDPKAPAFQARDSRKIELVSSQNNVIVLVLGKDQITKEYIRTIA